MKPPRLTDYWPLPVPRFRPRLLALFHSGENASVSVDTAPGRVFRAVVSEIARIAEPDGRTFRVKFKLLGAPPLLPGQTARIKVATAR